MYPGIIQSDHSTFRELVSAPFLGGLHYGALRFSAYLSTKLGSVAAEGPSSLESYLLMHSIGTAFNVTVRTICNLANRLLGPRELSETGILRRVTWKLIAVLETVQRKVDQLYSWIFRIRTADEAAKLPDRELYLTEIMRKLFVQHVKEQIMFISSWEVGRRGAEALLKCTIKTFLPSTIKTYVFSFIFRFISKIGSFRSRLVDEQKAEIKVICKKPIKLYNRLTEHVMAERNARSGICEEPAQTDEESAKANEEILRNFYCKINECELPADRPLTIDQKTAVLLSMFTEIQSQLSDFEQRWEKYPSAEIDQLKEFVEKNRNKFLEEQQTERELIFSNVIFMFEEQLKLFIDENSQSKVKVGAETFKVNEQMLRMHCQMNDCELPQGEQLTPPQKIGVLSNSLSEVQSLLSSFEERWKSFPSKELNDLKEFVNERNADLESIRIQMYKS